MPLVDLEVGAREHPEQREQHAAVVRADAADTEARARERRKPRVHRRECALVRVLDELQQVVSFRRGELAQPREDVRAWDDRHRPRGSHQVHREREPVARAESRDAREPHRRGRREAEVHEPDLARNGRVDRVVYADRRSTRVLVARPDVEHRAVRVVPRARAVRRAHDQVPRSLVLDDVRGAVRLRRVEQRVREEPDAASGLFVGDVRAHVARAHPRREAHVHRPGDAEIGPHDGHHALVLRELAPRPVELGEAAH